MSANPSKPNSSLKAESLDRTVVSARYASSLESQLPKFEALQALLAFSSLQEQIRQRRAAELGQATSAPPSWTAEPFIVDEVLQLVAERALSITGSDGIAVAIIEGSEVVCRASAGHAAPPRGAHFDASSAFSASCLREGRIVRCDDSEDDPRVDVEVCRRLGTRSMVALPLLAQDQVVGLIEAFSGVPYGFTDSDIRSLNLLSELVLAAMKPEEPLATVKPEPVQADVAPVTPPLMPSVEELQSALQIHKAEVGFYDSTRDEQATILSDYAEEKKTPVFLTVVFVIMIVALLAGAGVWWKMHVDGKRMVFPHPIAPSVSTESTQSATPADVDQEEPTVPAAAEGSTAQLTGIRHWSSDQSSTVVIDLQDHVQYEAHRLANPERIYFDLHDISIAPGLKKVVEIEDALLVRVRIAQPKDGITRVVLETKGSPSFSVSMQQSPYRLVVDVRPVGAPARPRATNLFAPLNPDAMASLADVVTPKSRHTAVAGKLRIALDAGHGGWDLGTVGHSGLQEKELVLDIVARLGQLLEEKLGAEVIYTREDDNYISLEKRTELANLSQADLFVSVHANYSDLTSAQGIETYYTNTYSSVRARTRSTSAPLDVDWTNVDIREKVLQSKKLAAEVQKSLFKVLSGDNPTLRDRGVKKASYVVLTGTTMPAVLAEVSFVSSPSDEAHLRTPEYRQQIADAIFKGVSGFKSEKRVTLARNTGRGIGR
jgi:N-acetylmuramoyl-L-alanine amidase